MSYRIAVSSQQLDRKLPPGDPGWSRFNASFANRELSRMDLADAIYTGHAITTWHKDRWRNSTNYLAGQHLGLDMDTEDERSTITRLIQDKFIAKYASLLHTTISHQPEAPRARVVFLLDTPIMQATNYSLAAAALLWVFGTADRQCKDPCRFFYGAPGCEIEYFENILPLETVKRIITQYQATGLREKRRRESNYQPTTDQTEAAQALAKIPPWNIDYDEWVSVLMALHSAFGETGLALAESWAEGYPGEVAHKWAGFTPTGNSSGAVTIATVFGIAKRFGWHKSPAQELSK